MGLDVVEMFLRCEEDFAIALENDRLERMQTAGDLFELICEKLGLPFGSELPPPIGRQYVPRAGAPEAGWTRDTVWFRLVQIVIKQLQVAEEDVTYSARFLDDLSAD
jgi:acyl carrier protein